MKIDCCNNWASKTIPLKINPLLDIENETLTVQYKKRWRGDSFYFHGKQTTEWVIERLTVRSLYSRGNPELVTVILSNNIYYCTLGVMLREDFTPVVVKVNNVWYHNPTLTNRSEVMLKNKLGAIICSNIGKKFYDVPDIPKFKTLKERKEHLEEMKKLYNNTYGIDTGLI